MRSDDFRVAPAVKATARAPTVGVSLARAGADRAAGGVPGCMDVPYCRHQQMVYRYCLGLLRSPEAAADAAQSTWLQASVVPPARTPAPVVPSTHSWLRAIARDECMEALRAARASRSAIRALGLSARVRPRDVGQTCEQLQSLLVDLQALSERQHALAGSGERASGVVTDALRALAQRRGAPRLECAPACRQPCDCVEARRADDGVRWLPPAPIADLDRVEAADG